ncbi:MAG: hypothetical protein IT365_27575 [Candidatus Hydrogenedentes bacterium]|nr:hypothetical protein [Candidatus Hydrogenedentota bacterium]
MAELGDLFTTEDWPKEWHALPCQCPEFPEAARGPGDPAFFRARANLAKRALRTLDSSVIKQAVAAGKPRDPFGMHFGWHLESTALTNLLVSCAYLSIQDVELESAEEYLDGLLHFADGLEGSPYLDLMYARAEVFRTLLMLANAGDLASVLPVDEIDHIVVQAARGALANDAVSPILAMAWYADEKFVDIVDKYGWQDEELMPSAPTFAKALQRAWIRTYGPFNPFLYYDRKAYVSTLLKVAELLERPYYEVVTNPEEPLQEFVWQSKTQLLTNWFAGTASRIAINDQAASQATARILALGLLVQRYHAEHGTCPESLEALEWPAGIDAETVAELLRDPYTGEPFQYTQQDGRCVIESETLNENYMCACVKRFVFPPGGLNYAR